MTKPSNSIVQIIIVFALISMFFAGGLYLDSAAAKLSVELSDSKDATETNKAIVQFTIKQADNLNASSRLLYDFSKIALGVLLTLITAGSTAQNKSGPEAPDVGQKKTV